MSARTGETDAAALSAERFLQYLKTAMGARITDALADDYVTEVMCNPDGCVWIDHVETGRTNTGIQLSASSAQTVIRLVADFVREPTTAASPRLQAVLPSGERFQGVLPPCAPRPAFTIRKPAKTRWTLADYVERGILQPKQRDVIVQAVEDRQNIGIVGGTGTGKTTLANAILGVPAFSEDRVVVIEELPELNCPAPDRVNLFTKRTDPPVTMSDLVRDSLRLRPERIVIGECRGPEALDMLKAWNTGHPGGLTTFHANSNEEALERVEEMIGEVAQSIPKATIARALNVLVFLSRRKIDGAYVRRVETVSRVVGHSPYRFEHIA